MKATKSLKTIYPWLIWSLAALFYAYEFFQRVSPSVMVMQLMRAFHVQAAALGFMSSTYYWIYVIMQIPAGLLVDRYGAHRILSMAIACVALGAFLFASINNLYVGSIARGLIGFGSSFAFVCSLKLITQWFPATRFALLAGLTQFIGYMGATIGGAPLGYLVAYIGWRSSIIYTAIFGAILAFSVFLVVREGTGAMIRGKQLSRTLNVLPGLKSVMTKKQTWINGIYACFMLGPTSVFAALWGIPYLVHVDGLTHEWAAGAVSLIFFGVAFGSPCFGWFSDKLQLRRVPLIYAALGALLITSGILYWHSAPVWMIYILCFFFGFFQSAHVLNFAVAHEINRPGVAGAAIGVTNMLTVIGGAIFQPLVGVFLELGWDGTKLHGVASYSSNTYQWSLTLLPVVQFLAFLIAIFLLKETHCRPKHNRAIDEMCAQA